MNAEIPQERENQQPQKCSKHELVSRIVGSYVKSSAKTAETKQPTQSYATTRCKTKSVFSSRWWFEPSKEKEAKEASRY
jgi:hypothetical protein